MKFRPDQDLVSDSFSGVLVFEQVFRPGREHDQEIIAQFTPEE